MFAESPTSAAFSGLPLADRLFAVDPATGALRSWQPGITGGSIDSLSRVGDVLVVTSSFGLTIGEQTESLFALDVNSAAIVPWLLTFDGNVHQAVVLGSDVVRGMSVGQITIVSPPTP